MRCDAEAVGEGTMLDCLHGGRPDHEDSMGRFRLACGRVDICGDGSVEQTGTVPGASPPGADPTRVPATSNELLGPRTSQNACPDPCYVRVVAWPPDTESRERSGFANHGDWLAPDRLTSRSLNCDEALWKGESRRD